MWYVIRVVSGMEDVMMPKIAKVLENFGKPELFVPRYVRIRKFHGEWQRENAVLFPGYVFVDTDGVNAEEMCRALHVFTEPVEPVCIGGGFYPIKESEQRFLMELMDGMHEIGFSVGNIVDGKLSVDEGPLKGLAGHVCRIDRHKRTAEVRMMLWGEEYRAKVGLEVKSKTV